MLPNFKMWLDNWHTTAVIQRYYYVMFVRQCCTACYDCQDFLKYFHIHSPLYKNTMLCTQNWSIPIKKNFIFSTKFRNILYAKLGCSCMLLHCLRRCKSSQGIYFYTSLLYSTYFWQIFLMFSCPFPKKNIPELLSFSWPHLLCKSM